MSACWTPARRIALATTILVLLSSAMADAQEPTAQQLVEEGLALMKQEKPRDALPRFKSAAKSEPSAARFCYVALTFYRLGDYPQAQLFYQWAQERDDGTEGSETPWCPRLAVDVPRALGAGGYAPIHLVGDLERARIAVSAFDSDVRLRLPRTIWLPTGRHTLHLHHPHHDDRQIDVDVTSAAPQRLRVRLSRSRRRPSRWSWAAIGAGGAMLATGGVFHALALGTKDDAEQYFEGRNFDDELSSYRGQRGLAIALYSGGATLIGLGSYLLLRSQSPAEATLSVTASGDRSSVRMGLEAAW